MASTILICPRVHSGNRTLVRDGNRWECQGCMATYASGEIVAHDRRNADMDSERQRIANVERDRGNEPMARQYESQIGERIHI